MKQIFTIGYEGANLGDFVATLQKANVDVLLDIRELPISRRRGFSKTALREALQAGGLDYRHERQLGSPKDLRHRLREDKDYRQFFRAFDRHLAKQTTLLEQLTEELEGNIALMCYERDYHLCHRSAVAQALATLTDLTPNHLGVEHHEPRKAHHPAHPYLGEGLSPA